MQELIPYAALAYRARRFLCL